jgi:uncharacterized PurR-regulated membrane protein YhhQ (DUF165 family)
MNSYGGNNNSSAMIIRGLVVLILMAMFLSGVFLVVEGTKNDPASEANKKWFGTGHIVAASLLAIGYIISIAP